MGLIIAAMIVGLGSENFAERQAATEGLRPFAQSLRGLQVSDLEAQRRLGFIIEDWMSTYRPTTHVHLPWLDMLPLDHPKREDIIQRLSPGWDLPPDWVLWRWSTSQYVKELIDQGTPKPVIIMLLDKMIEREAQWLLYLR